MSKTDCVNIGVNEQSCPCTASDCERHGVCCECLRTHLDSDSLPSCLRLKIQDSELFRENITNRIDQVTQ